MCNCFVISVILLTFFISTKKVGASKDCYNFKITEFNNTQTFVEAPSKEKCDKCGWFYADFQNGTTWYVGYCMSVVQKWHHFEQNAIFRQTPKFNGIIYSYPVCGDIDPDGKAHIFGGNEIPPQSYIIFCTCGRDKCNEYKHVYQVVARRIFVRENNLKNNCKKNAIYVWITVLYGISLHLYLKFD